MIEDIFSLCDFFTQNRCFFAESDFYSHNIDLVALELQLFRGILKCLIKHLVQARWATDPDLLQLSSIFAKFACDVLRVPSRLLLAATVRHSQGQLEVVTAKLLVDVDKGLDQVKTNRLLPVLEGNIEMELEAWLEEVHSRGDRLALLLEDVEEKKLRNEVKEDKHTCSCTKGHMLSIWLHLQTTAHRTLDVEHALFVGRDGLYIGVDSVRSDFACTSSVDTCGKAFGHIVGLEGQIDLALVLAEEHFVFERVFFLVEDALGEGEKGCLNGVVH